ncbi:MAG: histidine phosphatase family protein, partial [Erysipelotrichaceae bacterium]|nr:histidine phosphatase family protein [Erysipelotrichaceae bacterium]
GIIEARQAAEKFKGISFSYVFSSPLQRALQTAKIIVPDLEPIKDDRLIEMDYGPYEGSDLRKPDPELLRFFSDFVNEKAPEGMEELSHIVERTGEFLKEIQNLNGNILVSTHAIAMKGLLENLTRIPRVPTGQNISATVPSMSRKTKTGISAFPLRFKQNRRSMTSCFKHFTQCLRLCILCLRQPF